jgi:general stress protein YciG
MISPLKPTKPKSKQGFASMSKEKRQAIALKGGLNRKLKAEAGTAPGFSEIGRIGGKNKRKSK